MTTIRLDERRAVLYAAAVSALLHALMAGSLPLIITPDGGEYIRGALGLGPGALRFVELNRTPGYHAFLAATFALFGVGAGGILVAQNALATATCALLTWIACRLAGPRVGLAVGLLYAIEPWSLTFANYALTETATVFVVVVAAALVLCWRGGLAASLATGAVLGVACLMRPAIQAMVPFFALAWIVGRPATAPRRRAALAALLGAGFLGATVPWLAYNASRGVRGFAAGSGTTLWYGVAMAGLLDDTQPVDPATRAAVDRSLAAGTYDHAVQQVIIATRGYRSLEQDRRLGAWARASIAAHLPGYVAAVGYTALWQLNAGIAGKPPMYDELPFFADRLGRDVVDPAASGASNFRAAGALPQPWTFAVAWHGGVMQSYLQWAARTLRGIPQVPLFLCALVAGAVSFARGRYPLALLLTGTLVFVAAHAALLLPMARHAMPAWTLWYLALAEVLRLASDAVARRGALRDGARAVAAGDA